MSGDLSNRLRSLAGMLPQKHTLPSGADTVICSLEAFMQIKKLAGDAADAIEKLNKRIDFLMNCIYEAEDSLDRGADNDWARAALEKAERGQDDV